MKIAIPVNDKTMETTLCISFGRTPYFRVFDTETKESTLVENTAANSQGGAGIKAAQIVVDSNAEALLTPRCGENAANVLKVADIKTYKTMNDSLKDNLDAFAEGKLPELTEIHSGFHGHGGE